jgi:hypothetical protein
MKYIKQDLLTLLISLFILSACKNPDSIGLEVDPQYAINGALIDTSTIRTYTVAEDTIITTSLKKYPLGYMKDPVFGTTEANIALSLSLPNDNQTFGTNPVLDSAVLVLKYAGFYGDSLQSSYQINVHQLQSRLNANVQYSNRSNFAYNSTVIGGRSVSRVSLKDSVKVTEIVAGKADIQKNKAPQVRVPLNSTFITNNFLKGAAANFASNEAFRFIKGLYLTIDKTQSTGPGGVMFFDLSSDNASALEIYYKSENGAAKDTTMLAFKIKASETPVAANAFHNYTGTPIQTQLNNPNQQFNVTYVQGLGGVRTKVNFPYLASLKALGNITINKAELVIDVEGGAAPFTPAQRLILYRTDIANQRQSVPDLSSVDPRGLVLESQFGGLYDSVNKRYQFSITSYIQDIISGKIQQFDTFIAPADVSDDRVRAIFPSAITAGRSILGAKGNPVYKMKLNIIYTKTNN